MPVVRSIHYILFALLVLGAATVPASADSDWSVHSWQTDDGLPNNNITSIAQTADGYLWVATPSGLARFDGVQFEKYSPQLFGFDPGVRVEQVLRNRSGNLWLALDRGLIVGSHTGATQIFTNGMPERMAREMLEDDEGSLWATYTLGIVFRIKKNGESIHFNEKDGMPDGPVCSLANDHGRIWFAKSGQTPPKISQVGLYHDGHFETKFSLGRPLVHIAAARQGGIWLCNGSELLRYRDGEPLQHLGSFLPDRPNVTPTAILEARDGSVWIGTVDRGVFRFDGSRFESIETSHPEISTLFEDSQGNIWAGTFGGGLNRIRHRGIELQGAAQGLPFQTVRSLCEDSHGEVWAATENGLLAHYSEGSWHSVATNGGIQGGSVVCVAADLAGGVWLGMGKRVLCHLQGGVFTALTTGDGLAGRTIRSLLVSRTGDLWIGSDNPSALQCYRDGHFITLALPTHVRSIRAMTEDANGDIWAGTSGGYLLRINHDVLTDETKSTSNEPMAIRCLSATPDGSVWIGYAGNGLGRLKNGHYTRYTTAQGLYDDFISQIVPDGRGWLWFGCDGGIFKAQEKDLETMAEGKSSRIRSTHYGRDEGLLSLQANFETSPGAIRSSDGRVWLPMRTGLALIDPEALAGNSEPPPVLLRQVMVDEKMVAAYGGGLPVHDTITLDHSPAMLRLPPTHRRLDFQFTAPNLSTPENVHFRYRLDGFDDNWIEADTARSASYPRLPAGSYLFRVTACNSDGLWNDKNAEFAFVVRPFLWQTWWFQLVTLVVFTSLLIAIVRYISFRRLRSQLLALEQQTALDKERARIARDIHDDLGGSMTQIMLLSGLVSRDVANPEKTTGYAQRIAAAARNVTDALDEIVWAVNPRNDTLPHLINYIGKFASETLATAGVKYRLDLPAHPPEQSVSSDARHNLFLSVKESLNNATRHAQATEISLKIAISDHTMDISIEDNGKGFENPPKDAGEGLLNMRQRMEDIGGRFHLESRPGSGTRISFTLPLTSTSQQE